MPTISRFYGIRIRMFYDEHPPPHFHAIYGEYELVVGINPIQILEGKAPRRVRSLIFEWAAEHQLELLINWNRCRSPEAPLSIEPLE